MKAADALDGALWAMDEEWLLRLRAIALGEGEGPEAVAARLGRPLQNAQEATTRGSVAIIPVVGPIFRYANVFTQVSGATSIEIFARDLRVALDNPAVEAIVLEIDSPGGQVDGVNEAAQMIANAEKPIVAYVSGMGTSAAYWLASAADRVVIDATARLGSIGVVVAVDRERKARGGVIEIVSSQSPNKRPDVSTPEGRASIQSQVDAIADVFVDAVARNRGVDRATVLSEFGGGSVKVGSAAIAARMADSEGSLEQTISQLAAGDMPARRRRRMMAAKETTQPEATVTESELKAAVDKALAEGMDLGLADGIKKGRTEGALAERERILGIEAIALPGHEKLVAECKADGLTTPGEAAIKITEAEKATRARRLEAIRRDGTAAVIPANPTATGEVKAVAEDSARPLEERAKAKWDSDADLRAEFSDSFESYLAYRKADARGAANILKFPKAS